MNRIKQNWFCNMAPRWVKWVLDDHSFGVPDGKHSELKNIKKVTEGDKLFLYVNGKSGGIIGLFLTTSVVYEDGRESCLNFTHRIRFKEKVRLPEPIPFNQFSHKIFPNHTNSHYGNALLGKSIIPIFEQETEFLECLIHKYELPKTKLG